MSNSDSLQTLTDNINIADLFVYKSESYQSISIGDNRIILSCDDTLKIGDNKSDTSYIGSSFKDKKTYHIFGEDIILKGIVSVNNIMLSGKRIIGENGAVLDGSGKDGWNSNKGNINGPAGDNGYNIELFAESQDCINNFPIKLKTNGGKGSNGQESQNGSGGNGGNGGLGGNVWFGFNDIFTQSLYILQRAYQEKDNQRKVAYLKLYLHNINEFKKIIDKELDTGNRLTTMNANLIDLVKKGDLAHLNDNIVGIGNALSTYIENWKRVSLKGSLNIDGGDYGIGAFGPGAYGKNGNNGKDGSYSIIEYSRINDLINVTPGNIFVHPTQCSMMLNKAKMNYFLATKSSDSKSVYNTAVLLNRIVNKTSFAESLSKSSALYRLYEAKEASIGSANSISQLQSIYREASQLFSQIKMGKDYYGHYSSYAPLGSFSMYKGLISKLIVNFSNIESAYNEFYSNTKKKDAAIKAVKSARTNVQKMISDARAQIAYLEPMLQNTAENIAAQETYIKPKKENLDALYNQFEKKVKDSFNWNWKTVLSSLSVVAFNPGSPYLWAGAAAKTVYSGATTVQNSQGIDVNKDYVIQKSQSIESDMDSMTEGYSQVSDGSYAADDPGAGKLIADESKFNSFLDSFYNSFPHEISKIKSALKDYVDSIVTRNNMLLHYNALLSVLYKKSNLINDCESKISYYTDKLLNNINPDTPHLMSFMTKVYQDARNELLEGLYTTNKAFRFWSLNSVNMVTDALGDKAPNQINSMMLDGVQSSIITAYAKTIESFGHHAQSFPSSDNQTGIEIKFNDQQLENLKKSWTSGIFQTIVKIPVVNRDTAKVDNALAGMADVRLSKVRLWLEGIETDDDIVTVKLTHSGNEKICSTSNSEFLFTHQPMSIIFKYNLKTMVIVEDGDIGQTLDDSVYALVGPFTDWIVKIDQKLNTNLKMDNLSNARLEFHGQNYSFA